MWTNLAYGFLYLWVGATGTTDMISSNAMAYSTDMVPLFHSVVERCLATQTTNIPYSLVTQNMYRVSWRTSEYEYVTTSISNFNQTNAVTNIVTNFYLHGQQAHQQLIRPNDPHGFTSNINLTCFRISPLLWSDQLYSSNALENTTPGTVGIWKEAGLYRHSIVSNAWAFTDTNGDWIEPQFNWKGEVTNIPPFLYTIKTNGNILLDYNPTNQRPNSILPWITKEQMDVIDAKITNLFRVYLDSTTNYATHFSNQVGIYTTYVNYAWFETNLIDTIYTSRYYITENLPGAVYIDITTNVITGSSNDWDFIQEEVSVVEGTPEYYSYIITRWHTTYGWIEEVTTEESTEGTGDPDRVHIQTNRLETGNYGNSNSYNDSQYITLDATASTYHTNIDRVAIQGVGPQGEIDWYVYPEVPGKGPEGQWDRRVYVETIPGTLEDHTYSVVSNWSVAGTIDNHNRAVLIEGEGSQYWTKQYYIWSGVSNVLRDYMTPWIEDAISTSNKAYVYNLGWDPDYATGWKLWKIETNNISEENWKYNYWLDYSSTSYWKEVYQYFWNDTNDFSNPWHWRRYYVNYYLWDMLVITNNYWNVLVTNIVWRPDGGWEELIYRLYHTNFLFKKYAYVTNYYLDVASGYRVKVPIYPNTNLATFGSLTNFATKFPNLFYNTNKWLYQPGKVTTTNELQSFKVHTVTNSGGTNFTWTNFVWTSSQVTNPAVYSNAWAWPIYREALNQRMQAVTNMTDLMASNVVIESLRRTLSTTSSNTTAEGWESAAISTGTWNYAVSISRGNNYGNYTYSKTQTRVKRKAGMIMDGEIEVYVKFGTSGNKPLQGRYDLEAYGYPFGYYVKVDELCLPVGVSTSQWLGDISSPPVYPGMEAWAWQHPFSWTIQNAALTPIIIYKPSLTNSF